MCFIMYFFIEGKDNQLIQIYNGIWNRLRAHVYHTYIYIYIFIYIDFVCQVLMSKYIYKKLRHLFTKKLYFGFFQTFKDSIK